MAIAAVALSGWTVWWYSSAGDRVATPSGQCVMHQTRYLVNPAGVTRQAVLATAYWPNAGHVRVWGCYQLDSTDLSIDRSGKLSTTFSEGGARLCHVDQIHFSAADSASNTTVPAVLPAAGGEIDLNFSRINARAWIVTSGRDHVGLCISQ
ncbi:hypothetical protein KDW07_14635 [Burkholderia dolosa]|uniref:hypothetical protein n=1 Tax=Burkholderia dolosa TaxID=152500 RepID=UPI0015904A7C|nr:hypothetical protein [Burkholderia dolosa]MBR8458381.1 hypothetical protein [Burkholderia dolosa]